MDRKLVTLNLNYKGKDVLVNVDMATANILLNDPEQLEYYFQKLTSMGLVEETNDDDESSCKLLDANSNLWLSKGRPTEQDLMATQTFLELRKKYSSQFDDRKTIKMQIWQKIANELCDAGYNVGRGKEGALKCRQKFANLTRTYLAYIKHKKTTGAEKLDEPPFYNDLHEILGSKDKINPQNLQDSLEAEGSSNDQTNNFESYVQEQSDDSSVSDVSSASCSYAIKNRFSNISRTARPKNTSALLVLEEVKRQHKENLEQKEKQFKLLETHMKQNEHQNEKIISLMEKILDSRYNKQ